MSDPKAISEAANQPAPKYPMKPTVGRIVLFAAAAAMLGAVDKGQPFAAVITHVHSDDIVNLCILDDGSFSIGGTGTVLLTSVQQGSEPGQWDWMPYQYGQAAKTDKATELLATEVAELKAALDLLTSRLSSTESSLSFARSDISSVVSRVGPLETAMGTVLNRVYAVEQRPASPALTSSGGTEDAINRAFCACKTLANHLGNDGSDIIGVIHKMIDGPAIVGERVLPVHGTTCCTPHREPEPEPTTETKADPASA